MPAPAIEEREERAEDEEERAEYQVATTGHPRRRLPLGLELRIEVAGRERDAGGYRPGSDRRRIGEGEPG